MLITLWITQRENAYVGIDKWYWNCKTGEPPLAALETATSPLRFLFRATTCYDHLRRLCDISGLTIPPQQDTTTSSGLLVLRGYLILGTLGWGCAASQRSLLQTTGNLPHGMGRSHREELHYSETMSVRNVITKVKFAKVNLLEFSEAGPQPINDALRLNNVCHVCIHCMRDLEVV
jgi:hypothetical protein